MAGAALHFVRPVGSSRRAVAPRDVRCRVVVSGRGVLDVTSDVYVRCVNVNTYTVMVNTYIVISILYTNRTCYVY